MFSWRAFSTGDGNTPGAYLTVPALALAGIHVAFTARAGGAGRGPFDALDLSLVSGDDPDVVGANRARALAAIGAEPGAWTSGGQIHGATVAHTGAADRGRGSESADSAIPGTDALWTEEPGIALAVLVADCVPVLLADPVRKRIAVVHAGRRGLIAGVVENAARAMGGELQAYVGPAIGPCCYDVGEDVAAEMRAAFGDETVRDGRADLWRATRMALQHAGVRRAATTALCTRCEPHRFFSHRAGHSARQGLLAMIS